MNMYNLNDTEDKENYDPVVNTFSPVKLINQRRYKTLKSIVMKASSESRMKSVPLQERNGKSKITIDTNNMDEESTLKELQFKDETIRRFGL